MAIRFNKRDRDYIGYAPYKKAVYRQVERKGRLYSISGEDVELFKLSILAEAIDRTPHTILIWEQKFGFPKPMFEIPSNRIKRWYSGVQIMNIYNLMYGKYSGTKYIHETELFKMFMKDVQAVFYQRHIVTPKVEEIPL